MPGAEVNESRMELDSMAEREEKMQHISILELQALLVGRYDPKEEIKGCQSPDYRTFGQI